MKNDEIITKTVGYVKESLTDYDPGHDWWHIHRVWQMAKQIAKKEKADLFIVELAALLHDIADWKFHSNDLTKGGKVAKQWLESLGLDNLTIKRVTKIIDEVSYKGAGVKTKPSSLEGEVVQDADRLDAMGAIGIARAFSYGGAKNRLLHDPEIKPILHADFTAYKHNVGTTINHFHEKLLLLKDRLNTRSAQKIAEQRHRFLEQYLAQFLAEWDGKA